MVKFKLYMINYLEEAAAKGAAIKAEERERKRREQLDEEKKLRRERAIYFHNQFERWMEATKEQRRQEWKRKFARIDAKYAAQHRAHKKRAEQPRDPVTGNWNIIRIPNWNSWANTWQSAQIERYWRNYWTRGLRKGWAARTQELRIYKRRVKRMIKAYFLNEQIMRGQNWQLEFFGYVKIFVCLCIFCFCLYWVYYLITHLCYIWFYALKIKKNKHRRFYYDFYVLEKPGIYDIYNKHRNPRLADLEISSFRIKLYFCKKFIDNNLFYYMYKIATVKKCVDLITKYWEKIEMFLNEEIPCQWYCKKNKLMLYYKNLEKTGKLFFFVKNTIYLIFMFLIAFLITVFFLRIKNIIFFPFVIAMHCVDIIAVFETGNFYTFDYNSEFWNRCIFSVVVLMICVIVWTWLAFCKVEEKKKIYKQKYEQEEKLTAEFDKKYAKEIKTRQETDTC